MIVSAEYNSFPATLKNTLKSISGTLILNLFTDTRFLYGAVLDKKALTVWRVKITPKGRFQNLRTVLLPVSEAFDVRLDHVIRELVSEGAFDVR